MSEVISNDHEQSTEATRRVVAALYAAAKASDRAKIVEILHPDIVLRVTPSLPNAGVYHGPQNVLEGIAFVLKTFDTSQSTFEQVVVDGQTAVALINLVFRTGEGGCSVAEVLRVHDSRIIEIRPYFWDTSAIVGAAG